MARGWSSGEGNFNCRSRSSQAHNLGAEDFEGYRTAEGAWEVALAPKNLLQYPTLGRGFHVIIDGETRIFA